MSYLSSREWEHIMHALYRINTTSNYSEFAKVFFQQVRRLVPFSSANIFLLEEKEEKCIRKHPQGYPSLSYFINMDKYLAESENGSNYNVFAPWSIVYRHSDIETMEQLKESYTYKNYWGKCGILYVIQIYLTYENIPLSTISLFRTGEETDFTDKDLFIIEQLKNHLALKMWQLTGDRKVKVVQQDPQTEILNIPDKFNLTNREKEIVYKLYENSDRKLICDQLCISEFTLRKHICNIYSKLNVKSYAQLLLWIKDNLL